MPFCVICEHSVDRWLPHPHREYMGQFTRLVGAVGSNLERYLCPNCGCNDRDRHLWLYMGAVGLVEAIPESRILHIAPEARIEARVRSLNPREYVTGDLIPQRPEHRQIDVQELPFPSGSFELILCNHVLEHVADPDRAMTELGRCLTRDGHLVAQTPFAPKLKWTFEMSEPTSPQFARVFFGQEDHVRLFGADLPGRFAAAGLRGELSVHGQLLRDRDPVEFGCNEREPFFLFERD